MAARKHPARVHQRFDPGPRSPSTTPSKTHPPARLTILHPQPHRETVTDESRLAQPSSLKQQLCDASALPQVRECGSVQAVKAGVLGGALLAKRKGRSPLNDGRGARSFAGPSWSSMTPISPPSIASISLTATPSQTASREQGPRSPASGEDASPRPLERFCASCSAGRFRLTEVQKKLVVNGAEVEVDDRPAKTPNRAIRASPQGVPADGGMASRRPR
jgi:hypothetical protein